MAALRRSRKVAAVKLSSYLHLRVPNFSVHLLREVLEEANLDWRTALANAEIDQDAVDRPGGTIPARKELAFQLQFAALTRDRADLWIRAAQAYTVGTYGVLGLAQVTAPTIAAYVEAAHADSAPALIEVGPLRAPDGTIIGIEISYTDAPEELVPFSVHRDLCAAAQIFKMLYGGPFPFTRIEWPLADPSPEVLTYVRCDIDSGFETLRLWWDPAVSKRQLPFGNAFQHATWVKSHTEVLDALRITGDWPATVAKTIRAAPQLNRKLANVAVALQVSPRTLRRKLESTGHDFSRLRDETLSDLAADLLSHTDHSVTRISRMLGYTDPASFTIAFKRWKGMPPTAFREASHYRNNANSQD
jgi:AraC-like DNA-binding protein